jgi:hypothetical protein
MNALKLTPILCLMLATGSIAAFAGSNEKPGLVMQQPAAAGFGLPQIVNGNRQELEKWPATLVFTTKTLFCTSTIIGDNVVITAAHCLAEGLPARVHLNSESPSKLTCDIDSAYTADGLQSDVALCKSVRPFPKKIKRENLDLTISDIRNGINLFLLGYGCRQPPPPGEPPKLPHGQLYGGLSGIVALPRDSDDHIFTQDGVVICDGDSGGAAYILGDETASTGPRSIVGVNSGYDPKTRQSAIASLQSEIAKFVTDWVRDHAVTVCGINSTMNCRDKFVP